MLQADTTQEVKPIACHGTGAMTDFRDSEGAYTTVVLVGEEDEVTHEDIFRLKTVGLTISIGSMLLVIHKTRWMSVLHIRLDYPSQGYPEQLEAVGWPYCQEFRIVRSNV